MTVEYIYDSIIQGNYEPAFIHKVELNTRVMELLNKEILDPLEVEELKKCIIIGNATYENTDADILPIEDGIWDMMTQKYRRYTPNDTFPIGSIPKPVSINNIVSGSQIKTLFVRTTDEEIRTRNKMIFPEIIDCDKRLQPNDIIRYLFEPSDTYITKRLRETGHNHPDLVGTFDKCKFVLESQAEAKGVLNDANVSVMERDFFRPLLEKGIIDYNTEITMIATLKYDGISVEADVTDSVISARTRGDTGEGKASDITPILGGYRFPRTEIGFCKDNPIGMKFEAIVNKYNLVKLNQMKGTDYKNCRTAIIGISSSSDAYRYRDLITLVPISTDYKDENGEPLDRLVEISFLNQYYTRDQLLRYSVLSGTYTNLLFQIKKYVEEAEYARAYLPFMYDGVVFEFYDKNIRDALGRDNSMDRYKCAIKFNPMTKQTIFRGYQFTVGMDGTITPMIYYDPIEFFGTTHPKSSGHSLENFKKLDLHVGDIIEVTYMNDVITYVTKPDNSHNKENAKMPYTELDSFPTICPACGSKLVISDSGRSAYCSNIECPERAVQRLTTTLARLSVVNFGEETVRALGYTHLYQFIHASVEDFAILGENNKVDLYNQLQNIRKSYIRDYKALGALGFSGIADKTWKLIMEHESIDVLGNVNDIKSVLPKPKGIGPKTVQVIANEWGYFEKDIKCLIEDFKLTHTLFGEVYTGMTIRFSGCRDTVLEKQLEELGHDVDGNGSVTKKTDILLVPYESYSSSKVTKAQKYGVRIVTLDDFRQNMDQYL